MYTKNDCRKTSNTFENQLLVYERCFSVCSLLMVITVLAMLGNKMFANLDDKRLHATEDLTLASAHTEPAQASYTVPELASFKVPSVPKPTAKPKEYWKSYKITRGQNLAGIFKQLDIDKRDLRSLLHSDPLSKQLKKIRPGQTIKMLYVANTFAGLEYVAGPTYSLTALRNGDSFEFSENKKSYDKQTRHVSATIKSSLFVAAKKAGISSKTTMELAKLFGWDIDFALDIRKGDRFSVVYQTFHHDGRKVKDGDILAAEFVNKGKVYRAVKYTDPEGNSGYYSPQGENMHKPFLRTPVDFTRISSRFGKRYHPVLNKMRSHNGVDYAAPRGTVVRSSGDGKIIFRGSLRGYGKTVIIEHGAGYRTLYAHLHKYRKGQGMGSTVKQGQTVGYVGSTGLASGPHLHYEFLINGEHRNPLTIKLPTANPLNNKYLADFQQKARSAMAILSGTENKLLALNSFAQ